MDQRTNDSLSARSRLELIEAARESAGQLSAALLGSRPPPDLLPGFELVRELHRGGQGVVYRATHKRTGRDVAIKVVRGGPFLGPQDKARFEREVHILGHLKHSNIVTIHDSGTAAGCHYFVMDYISGKALDLHMVCHDLSIAETLRLFSKICKPINAAHLRGVIHRDLKPSNILIDESGEPHILDFGLAKADCEAISDAARWQAITVTGQFFGSVPWASPEQVSGARDQIDLRTDVYSLGVILYHMLTQRFPYFLAGSMRDVLSNILEIEPIRPSTVRKDIDGEVETIILKCLAKEPDRRYQSAAALAEDINRYLTHQPITARAPTTVYQLKKLVERNKLPFAFVATLFGLVLGFGVWMSVLYGRAEVDQTRAANAERQAEHQRAEAVREAETVKAINEFLVNDLLAAAQPEVAQGSNITVEDVLKSASERIEGAFPNRPLTEAAIRSAIGQSYVSLGLYSSAEPHLRTAQTIRTRELGKEHPDTLRSESMLVDLLCRLGQYTEADRLSEETLELMRDVLGEEHIETLQAAHQRARMHWHAGRVPEAERLLEDTLERRRRILGDQHPDTLHSLTEWGSITLMGRKETAKAEQTFREALESCVRVLGDNHPQTLKAAGLVAYTLCSQRKFAAAEEMFQQSLEGHRRVLGADHPDTLVLKWRIAKLRQGQARLQEAIDLFREVMEVGRRVLGAEHPVTLQALEALGHMLLLKGAYPEALAIHRQTLEIHRRRYGIGGGATQHSLDCLGMVLLRLGRYAEAEARFREAYAIMYDRMGNCEAAVGSLRGLIRALAAQGRQEEARPFAEELLRLHREGAEGADTDAYRVNCYARALLTVEPADLRNPEHGLEVAQRAFTMSSDDYHYNRYTLALAHEMNGEPEKAVAMLRRALAHVPIEVSEERNEYETTLVGLLERMGDVEGAEQIYRDTLAKRREHFPEGHGDIASSLEDLCVTLIRHGKHAEAEPLLWECLEIRQEALPEEHWQIGHTMSVLGALTTGQVRFKDAEPLLIEGYTRLLDSPMAYSNQTQQALERIESLYQTWGDPDRALTYREMLPGTD
ncbi:MAG: serine/threonine protein kinase [Phycisphaerales bacterium]|nr:MAG: serine/threonine protein kinase [Phycisphaerales bacterium]